MYCSRQELKSLWFTIFSLLSDIIRGVDNIDFWFGECWFVINSYLIIHEISSPFSFYCILCRWAWSSTEEDLHQMGKLSLRQSDLSHWWPVHWPARWPHAYPPSGSALRRTAGQYRTETTLSCPKLNTGPQHDPWPCTTSQEEKKIHVLHYLIFWDLLLLLLLLVSLF